MTTARTVATRMLISGVLLLTIACGSGSTETVQPAATPMGVASPPATPVGAGPVNPLSLCIDDTALPGTSDMPGMFVIDGEGEISNAYLAENMPNRAVAEQELAAWGRLTGAFRQWAFVTETQLPTKQQERSMPTSTLEAIATQESIERLSVSIYAVICQTEMYLSAEGAQAAFASRIEPNRESVVLAPNAAVSMIRHEQPGVAEESASLRIIHTYHNVSAHRFYTGAFRDGNVIGHMRLNGSSCDVPGGLSFAEIDERLVREGDRMLAALAERVGQARSVGHGVALLPEDTIVPTPSPGEPVTTNPDFVQFLLPTLYEVNRITGLELSEADFRHDLSQLFEHVDLSALTSKYLTRYRGDDAGVIVQLALFTTADAAASAYAQIHIDRVGTELDVSGIGDAATGRVAPPSEGNPFVTTIMLVRVDRALIGVTVLSHDPEGLPERTRELARFQSDIMAANTIRDQTAE
jgi:hypothetical protein